VHIARMDADSTRLKGSLSNSSPRSMPAPWTCGGHADDHQGPAPAHHGVAAVNPDSALFSSDFRPERMFSL
jgi:hypothetical protein